MSLLDLYPNGIFISHTSVEMDTEWAKWIDFILNKQGIKTTLDVYDFTSSPIKRMDEALKTQALLCVHSERYASGEHRFASAEWQSLFAAWKEGQAPEHHLLVLCVDDTDVQGLLAEPRRGSVHGKDRDQAVAELLRLLNLQPQRPSTEPDFPGQKAEPVFPGKPLPLGDLIGFLPPALDEMFPRPAELGAVQDKLAKSERAHLFGMPGVGKTRLACAYAMDHRSRYSRIIWLNAESTDALRSQFADLATNLGLPPLTDQDRQISEVRNKLSQQDDWLLIFDDIEETSKIEALIPPGLSGNRHVLTTGREPRAHGVEITSLDADTATRFLCTPEPDDATARAIAQELGGLPIALSLARHLRALRKSWRQIQQDLASQKLTSREDQFYGRSVAAMFDLAVATARKSCADLDDLLAVFTLLAPEPVPLPLLERTLAPDRLADGLDALVAVGLVQQNESFAGIHNLFHSYCRRMLPPVALTQWAQILATEFGRIYDTGHVEGMSVKDIVLHATALQDHGPNLSTHLRCWLHLTLAQFHYWGGALDNALNHAIKAQNEVSPAVQNTPQDPMVVRCLFASYCMIGLISVDQGNLADGGEAYHQSLEIAKKLAQSNPGNAEWQKSQMIAHLRIGDVLLAQKKLDDALRAYHEGLEIAKKLAQLDPANTEWQRDLSVSYNKIGYIMLNQRNLTNALHAYHQGFKIAEALWKSNPGNIEEQRDLSISLEKIGNVLAVQGKFGDALGAFQQCMEIREKLAGSDHGNAEWQRDLALSHGKIGETHRRAQAYAPARKALTEGRRILADLVTRFPDWAEWQSDLQWFDTQIATLPPD